MLCMYVCIHIHTYIHICIMLSKVVNFTVVNCFSICYLLLFEHLHEVCDAVALDDEEVLNKEALLTSSQKSVC
jgi:hypothetical protein